MKTESQAIDNYEDGVRNFGVNNYTDCADRTGWYAVAECLHDAKARALTLDHMVDRYRDSA